MTELVRSILQDEPMKMRRLADIFRIDVASIHSMMLLHMEEAWLKTNGTLALKGLSELLASFYKTVVADIYEGELVIFVEGPRSLGEEKEILEGIKAYMKQFSVFYTITCCNHLADTAVVRKAFLLHRSYIEDTIAAFSGEGGVSPSGTGICRRVPEKNWNRGRGSAGSFKTIYTSV